MRNYLRQCKGNAWKHNGLCGDNNGLLLTGTGTALAHGLVLLETDKAYHPRPSSLNRDATNHALTTYESPDQEEEQFGTTFYNNVLVFRTLEVLATRIDTNNPETSDGIAQMSASQVSVTTPPLPTRGCPVWDATLYVLLNSSIIADQATQSTGLRRKRKACRAQ